MKRTLFQVVALGLIAFPGVCPLFGQVQYVHTTNLLAEADATMSSGAPDVASGNQSFLITGVDGGETNRALFRFDVSGLPTNATVQNVTLGLVEISQPSSSALFGISLLLSNWNEYEVTWNNRSSLMPWTVPGGQAGGDFYSFPSGTAVLPGNYGTTNRFTDDGSNPYFGLVHDVQTWVNNPAKNFGWLLAAVDESSSGSMFLIGSREFSGYGPMLTVAYTQPFTPPTITAVSIANGLFQFSFNVEPYHGYGVQFSGDLDGTNWVTIRVLDPPPYPTVATDSEFLTASNRFFRVIASQ